MLIDFKPAPRDHITHTILAMIAGSDAPPQRLAQGIYQIHHFSGDHEIDPEWRYGADCDNKARFAADYPQLGSISTFGDQQYGSFNNYGVCDEYQQVLDQCPELLTSDRGFVLFVTEVAKATQAELGGWRWHKWGPYIGTQEPQREYLKDEPLIERVFVFNIVEIINKESLK